MRDGREGPVSGTEAVLVYIKQPSQAFTLCVNLGILLFLLLT